MKQPLKNITVISLEHAIAAPFATRQLADLGAKVIKVERLEGDFARDYDRRARGWASYFVWANRGKYSVSVNLKHDEVLEALKNLLKTADVFIQNLAPKASQRMGLDFEHLHAINPKLIVCDISGYGIGGSYQDQKAYDLLIQAQSGFLSVTGTPDDLAKAGPSIADISAGMYAYSQILAALYERNQTGLGQHIDISMLESMVEWMGYPLYYAIDDQMPPSRNGASHATIFPYGPFKTADNEWVLFGLQNPREWRAFCLDVLLNVPLAEDSQFYSNTNRVKAKAILEPFIRKQLALLNRTELQTRLEKAGIANATVNQMKEVWSHPQLKDRQRWFDMKLGEQTIPSWLPPGSWEKADFATKTVPHLGEHTLQILEEAGLATEHIQSLMAQGEVNQYLQCQRKGDTPCN